MNDDTVVFLEAARFERVGEAAGALHKLAVGDLNDHGIVGLDIQCALVAEAGFDPPVETLARGFQDAVLELLEDRRVLGVQHFGGRRFPAQQPARPERQIKRQLIA